MSGDTIEVIEQVTTVEVEEQVTATIEVVETGPMAVPEVSQEDFDAHVNDETGPHGIDDTGLLVARADLRTGLFSVYRAAALSLAASTTPGTEVPFDTESGDETFDLDGWFNPTTGRFTPQVAGYYRFSWSVNVTLPANRVIWSYGARNAVEGRRAGSTGFASLQNTVGSSGSGVWLLDGVDDYFSVWACHTHTSAISAVLGFSGQQFTHLSGELIARAS